MLPAVSVTYLSCAAAPASAALAAGQALYGTSAFLLLPLLLLLLVGRQHVPWWLLEVCASLLFVRDVPSLVVRNVPASLSEYHLLPLLL
jgi:hypothetical protein